MAAITVAMATLEERVKEKIEKEDENTDRVEAAVVYHLQNAFQLYL